MYLRSTTTPEQEWRWTFDLPEQTVIFPDDCISFSRPKVEAIGYEPEWHALRDLICEMLDELRDMRYDQDLKSFAERWRELIGRI